MNWCSENVCATIFFAKVSSDFFADKKSVVVIGPGKLKQFLLRSSEVLMIGDTCEM